MDISKKSFVFLALAATAAAHATDVTGLGAGILTPGAQGWYVDNNTDPLAPATIDTTFTNDGDGALHFAGTGNEKKYATFGAPQGVDALSGFFSSLGSLGQLAAGSVSADIYRASTNPAHQTLQVAVKVILSGNRQLTWESAYNDNLNLNGSWVTEMMGGSGKWWLRGASTAGNVNFDQIVNLHSLSDWAAGGIVPTAPGATFTGTPLSASDSILGFSVGYGSGVGAFDGAIDHLNVNFTGGSSYNYNFKAQAVPEPASMAALGLGALALIRRRRNRA